MTDYDIAEGVEDALSIRLLRRNREILGLPGIGALQHLDLRKGDSAFVFKDGDEEGSAAAKALTAGLDTLLLDNVAVRVTRTPPPDESGRKFDANRILQEQGLEALRGLATQTYEPALSFHGHCIQLSKITDPVAYARKRKVISEMFNDAKTDKKDRVKISVKLIDKEVEKHRRAHAPEEQEDPIPGVGETPPDPEWDGDVDLAQALDTAVTVARRFLQAPAYVYDTTALWSLMTHLVQSEEVALVIAPQLAFQSAGPDSGKSVALEIASTLSARGHLRSSYSAATLFRKINQDEVTPCLSELHNVLRGGENTTHMLEILNACHRRSEAFVDRCETDPQTGKRPVMSFKCWAAIAWTSVGQLHNELQSRAIPLFLQAALPDESTKLDHIHSPKLCKELIDVRRQFAKFAATVKQPLNPKTMPKHLFNRGGDNFRPLFALAEMAGSGWPERIADAVEKIRKVDREPPMQVWLLTCIRTVLENDPDNQLATTKLIDELCEEEEWGWQQANKGKRIDAYWLRTQLRGLLNPPGSQHWRVPDENKRIDVHGYQLHQFKDAFLRLSIGRVNSSSTSSTSSTASPKSMETHDFPRARSVRDGGDVRDEEGAADGVDGTDDADGAGDVRDGVRDHERHRAQKKSSKLKDKEDGVRDVLDVLDESTLPTEREEEAESIVTSEAASDVTDGTSEKPNGPLHASKRQRSNEIAERIRAAASAHPEWDAAQIGKSVGRTASVVQRILGSEQ